MGIVRSRFRFIAVAGAMLVLLLLLAIPAIASAHSTSSAQRFSQQANVVSDSSTSSSQTAAPQIKALINTVNGFHLNPLVQQLLVSPLQAALKALTLTGGGTKAACSDIASFTSEVGLQAGKGLTIDQARQLFSAAVSIEKTLGC